MTGPDLWFPIGIAIGIGAEALRRVAEHRGTPRNITIAYFNPWAMFGFALQSAADFTAGSYAFSGMEAFCCGLYAIEWWRNRPPPPPPRHRRALRPVHI